MLDDCLNRGREDASTSFSIGASTCLDVEIKTSGVEAGNIRGGESDTSSLEFAGREGGNLGSSALDRGGGFSTVELGKSQFHAQTGA